MIENNINHFLNKWYYATQCYIIIFYQNNKIRSKKRVQNAGADSRRLEKVRTIRKQFCATLLGK